MEFLLIFGGIALVVFVILFIVGGVVGTYEEVSGDAYHRREYDKTNGSNYFEE